MRALAIIGMGTSPPPVLDADGLGVCSQRRRKVMSLFWLSVGWRNHPAFVSGKFIVCACSIEVS
jgi:hypothetical protein